MTTPPDDLAEDIKLVRGYVEGNSVWGKPHALEALDRIAARLAQPVMEGWRPIETAPRDGTTIMLWHGKSGLRDRVVVGAYDKDAEYPWRFLNNPFPLIEFQHGEDDNGMENAFTSEPTHWLPLPQPPSVSE